MTSSTFASVGTRSASLLAVLCAVAAFAGAIVVARDRSGTDRSAAPGVQATVDPSVPGAPAATPSPLPASPSPATTPSGVTTSAGPSPREAGYRPTTAPPTHAPASPAQPRSPAPSPTKAPASPTPPGPVTRVYEAESGANEFGGGAQPSGCATCSGGADVRWVGYGGTLQINGVVSTAGGSAALTISYVNGDSTRWCLISIDGGNGNWVSFPSTGGWTAVGSVTLSVGLRAGTNRFLFAFNRGWCPDFDAFSVRDPA
ncbi:MAG TPA: hypothetical protein VJT31_10175 [Rugosimonospora sp.]|nr:hypothetical protein [Rugosimonospora sp.]